MRALLDWDPSIEMEPLAAGVEPAAAFTAAFDIKETKDAYEFKADVPGVQEKDLEVTIAGNRLAVSGKREEEKEEKSDRNYTYERSFGSFSRSFTLPDGADTEKVQANLEKGVLTVSVPKKPEVQPKKIAVSSESSPKS
jgi:HSP20 family protein